MCLWNLEDELNKANDAATEPMLPMEPQRRFQDGTALVCVLVDLMELTREGLWCGCSGHGREAGGARVGLGLGRCTRRVVVAVRRVHLCHDRQCTVESGLRRALLQPHCDTRRAALTRHCYYAPQDSVFKVWDIREPRLCIRSHRIRSTWGLSLQWMDPTSIQISGDQGMIYMYDILVRTVPLLLD